MRRPATAPCVSLFVLTALAAIPLAAADGDLDPSFDADGFHRYAEAASFSFTSAIVAPDGATVVFGAIPATGAPAFHWRRLEIGSISSLCTFVPPGTDIVRPQGATFDAEGRLLLLAHVRLSGDSKFSLGVLRYVYPACDLDETLGGDGYVVHAPALAGFSERYAAGLATARWLIFPPSNYGRRILVAFTMQATNGSYSAFLLRLLHDGALDTGFGGGDGVAPVGDDWFATGIGRTPDARFVVAGQTGGSDADTVVRRFDRDGALDPAFGNSGTARVDLTPSGGSEDALGAVSIGADGRIWLAGRTWSGSPADAVAAVAVLSAGGVLDPSFSGDGWRTFAIAGAPRTRFRAASAQGDGRVLVAGDFEDPATASDDEAFVARFTRAGALDSSFAAAGVRSFALDGVEAGEDLGTAVAIRPDGRLWVAGSTATDDGFGGTAYRPFVALLRNALIFADSFERGSIFAW